MNFDFVPVLAGGPHDSPREGACVMEMVSFMSGDEWTDTPKCSGMLITYLAQRVNDKLTDKNRGLIMQHFHRLFGTSDSSQHSKFLHDVRAYAAEEAMKMYRAASPEFTPKWWGENSEAPFAKDTAKVEIARLRLMGRILSENGYGNYSVQHELIVSLGNLVDYTTDEMGVRILGDILDIYDAVFNRTHVPTQDISKLAELPGQVTVDL